MSKVAHADQLDRFSKAINNSIKANGVSRIGRCELALADLLTWLDYLKKSEVTGCCDEFIAGIRAAGMEAAGGIALGLIRLAIFAMRGQIDLALAWLFFKDHPIEWKYVLRTGEEFKSRKEVFEFLDAYQDKFSARLNLLEKYKTRKISDPYRLLSAHIHSQTTLVMPKFTKLEAMVYPEKLCAEGIKLQSEVSEYVSDIFLAYFGDKWASLPDSIIAAAKARIPSDKQPTLFS